MVGTSDFAFTVYFAERVAALRRSAYLLTGNWHDAEDVVRATFVRLYSVWHRVRHESADAYVRQVLFNVFLNTKRDQRNPVADADDRLAGSGALSVLTPSQRAVVVLRYWEDLSVAETAEVLGVSEDTVKSQMQRAESAMRPWLREDRGAR